MPRSRPTRVVIHGETDDVVPLSATLDWARPQALPVIVFPGVGHFFHGQLGLLKNIVVRELQRPDVLAVPFRSCVPCRSPDADSSARSSWSLARALSVLPSPVAAHAQAPQPPEVAAKSYLVLDLTSNQTLAERNADAPADPASLTKLMTAYVVFQARPRQEARRSSRRCRSRSAPGTSARAAAR